MTQDEIIRMAREAGFEPRREMGVWEGAMHELKNSELNKLKRFAALVAAHEREKEIKRVAEGHGWTQAHWTAYEESVSAAEREACAKVCDEPSYMQQREKTSAECAAAIRARGEK